MLVYVLVLVGSIVGICLMALCRLLLKQQAIRRFVRSMKQRLHAVNSGTGQISEKIIERCSSGHLRAADVQQIRGFVCSAQKALARQKTEDAERYFIQALTVSTHAYEARAELAKLYLTTGRTSKAEAMYRELILDRPEISFFANLGLACYQQGKFTEACAAYKEAYEQDPKNPMRAASLGRSYMAAGLMSEAAEYLEKASCGCARDTELLRLLAECYVHVGDRAHAQEVYRRVNKLEPYDEDIKERMLALAGA
ncbi:tetratricopeptide repeat protein [Candidatus Peregrinibacteria bacterium]|nr:tetratricopeptide repeat protein [Candidatus Peregrinibacteria bacterium]